MSEGRRGGGCTSLLSLLLIMGLVITTVIYLAPNIDFGNVRRTVGADRMDGVAGSGGEGYTFMQLDSNGDPITWECEQRIEILVNPAGAPEGYAEIVDQAVGRLDEVTSFSLVVTGETDDRAFLGRGRGPVLLGWADEDEVPALAGATAGLGGSAYVSGPGGEVRSVGGMVVVDTEAPVGGWFRVGIDQEVIIVHELMHVLGLGHTEQTDQVMAAENSGQDELGEGDLAGLAALEEAACG